MVSGNIAITATPAYCTYAEWYAKYGISTTDETEAQFATDLKEAHVLVRRNCFFLVRERIIFKRGDLKAYLPLKWLTDGNMDGTVDTSDIIIHQISSDGLGFDAVDSDTYLDSVDAFNNSITFTAASSALSRLLFATFFICSKPFDEVIDEELKRVVMAQVTVLCIERLRKKWGLKGGSGWTAGGVTINKDLSSYKELYDEALNDLKAIRSFLKPTVLRAVKTGMGSGRFYDSSVAWSDQFLGRSRVNKYMRFI